MYIKDLPDDCLRSSITENFNIIFNEYPTFDRYTTAGSYFCTNYANVKTKLD